MLALLAAGAPGVGPSLASADMGVLPAAAPASLQALLQARNTAGLQSLPVNGDAALTSAIDAVGADLGIPTDATARVAAAALPQAISSRVAVVLQDLHVCDQVTSAAMGQLQPALAGSGPDSLPSIPPATADAIQSCAGTAYSDGLALKDYLQPMVAASSGGNLGIGGLDVWPVVHLDLGGASDTYAFDYVLIVDTGGTDTYLNNAGGNLIDVKRSPSSSSAARGCEVVSDFLENTNPECLPASAMVIQMGGNDQFEQLQSADADRFDASGRPCATATWSGVRRIVTEGAAVAGVGILINTSVGTSTYLAKTSSQGAGHIGGVGILDVEGGVNTFSAVRNSQGFGFIGGLGLVHSEDATNSFGWYAPSGGVVSDNGTCDSTPRHLQGSGQLGGVGALVAENSPGTYVSNTTLAQGAGDLAPSVIGGPGVGILVSRGAAGDSYSGVPGRGSNGERVGSRADLSAVDSFVDVGGPPSVTSVSPGTGNFVGGQSVTITGSGFFPQTEVLFGGVPSPLVTVVDQNTIIAISPPNGPGQVHVSVRAPAGSSTQSFRDGFTYCLIGGQDGSNCSPGPV